MSENVTLFELKMFGLLLMDLSAFNASSCCLNVTKAYSFEIGTPLGSTFFKFLITTT